MPYTTQKVSCAKQGDASSKLRALQTEKTKIIKELIDVKKVSQQSNLMLIKNEREITKLKEELSSIKNQNDVQLNKAVQKSKMVLLQKDREINQLVETLNHSKNQNDVLANEVKEWKAKYQATKIENTNTAREFKTLTAKFKQLLKANDAEHQSKISEMSSNSDDGEYDVDQLLDDKITRGKRSFLVKWKNSWVKESNLDCQSLLKNYSKSKNSKK